MTTLYREGCGTHRGLLLHQANGEEPCAQCRLREAVRLLELEAIPTRPSPPPFTSAAKARAASFLPVTELEAAAHRRELIAELDAFEASPAWLERDIRPVEPSREAS